MFWQLFVAVVLLLITYSYWRKRKIVKLSKLPEFDAFIALPLIGHGLYFAGNNEHILNMLKKFGREAIKANGTCAGWAGESLIVVTADADMADFFLKNCLEKGYQMNFLKLIVGRGLLVAPVPIWRPRRKLTVPIFAPRNLKHFFEVFVSKSQLMVHQLSERAGAGPFSFWPYLTAYNMDAVCANTLGVEISSQKKHHPFPNSLNEAMELVSTRIVCPWLYADAIYKLLPSYRIMTKLRQNVQEFIQQIIKSKREGNIKDMEPKRTRSILELFMDASNDDSGCLDDILRDDMIIFIGAGTDTSAAAAGFTALMLARHQDVQQKVYQELQEVFGDSTKAIHLDDLPRLKYLECVIKESMRLYPPVPVILRDADEDIILPSGGTLLKGTTVAVAIWAVHRNPRYWGADAEQFRPERFLDTTLAHPAQYMAFSHGPRNCPGGQYAMMSLKALLSTLLRRYRVLPEALPATTPTDSPIRLTYGVMMKDVNNFMIRLEPRA